MAYHRSRQRLQPTALRPLLGLLAVVGLLLAASAPVAAQSVSDIVAGIEQNGYFTDQAVDGDLAAAIERANNAGTAFVWLEQAGAEEEAAELAGAVWDQLDAQGSPYGIVIVLLENGYNIQAPLGFDGDTLAEADLAALAGFSTKDVDRGLDDFTSALTAGSSTGSGSATTPTTQAPSSGGSGGGFSLSSLLLPLILVGGGFLLFRGWSGRRKADQAMKAEIEADRAEIKEQLRDNADRVIDLGDRVVLSENRELIDAYEEASRTYQEVSHEIDSADTVEEVDDLDDRIDHAEWQLEKIEATLEGRPIPPSPAEVEAEEARHAQAEEARRKAENDKPALGRDESVLSPRGGSNPSYPRTSYPQTRRRRSSFPGGMGRRGGGFGGGLGGILGSIILGQMRRPQTRRTQRRSGSLGGGSRGGSLGGGVLRRGGSSSRSGRQGSGRSFGRSGRQGSGRSF